MKKWILAISIVSPIIAMSCVNSSDTISTKRSIQFQKNGKIVNADLSIPSGKMMKSNIEETSLFDTLQSAQINIIGNINEAVQEYLFKGLLNGAPITLYELYNGANDHGHHLRKINGVEISQDDARFASFSQVIGAMMDNHDFFKMGDY